MGPLHDPVTWYKIIYTGEQVAQWDFQNIATRTSSPGPAFVLEVPLRNLLTSIYNFVPCDRIVQRAHWTGRLVFVNVECMCIQWCVDVRYASKAFFGNVKIGCISENQCARGNINKVFLPQMCRKLVSCADFGAVLLRHSDSYKEEAEYLWRSASILALAYSFFSMAYRMNFQGSSLGSCPRWPVDS